MSILFDMFELLWIFYSFDKSLSIFDMTMIIANSGIKNVFQRIFSKKNTT